MALHLYLVSQLFLGKSEKKRLGAALDAVQLDDSHHEATEADELKRPHLFIFNIALIIIAVVVLIKSILPPAAVFMIATAIALLVNYPDKKCSLNVWTRMQNLL